VGPGARMSAQGRKRLSKEKSMRIVEYAGIMEFWNAGIVE